MNDKHVNCHVNFIHKGQQLTFGHLHTLVIVEYNNSIQDIPLIVPKVHCSIRWRVVIVSIKQPNLDKLKIYLTNLMSDIFIFISFL